MAGETTITSGTATTIKSGAEMSPEQQCIKTGGTWDEVKRKCIRNGNPNTTKPIEAKEEKGFKLNEKSQCIADGGIWDEAKQHCTKGGIQDTSQSNLTIPTTQREQQEADLTQSKMLQQENKDKLARDKAKQEANLDKPLTQEISSIDNPDKVNTIVGESAKNSQPDIEFLPDGSINYTVGDQKVHLSRTEYKTAVLGKGGELTDAVKEVKSLSAESRRFAEGQALSNQVGQFKETDISPTGLNYGEAATEGIVSGIPSTLKWLGGAAVGGAIVGSKVGAVGGTIGGPAGMGAGALIGGTIGVIGGISASMIGNMKSQRRDTTTAQQRVLDEGKQTMKDWATMAKNDPSNKERYLAEYNKVSAQINQAYRQMKLDTSRDVTKFETALPNLAEFEAFYSAGGERDSLDVEMRLALQSPKPMDYDIYNLANKYGQVKT